MLFPLFVLYTILGSNTQLLFIKGRSKGRRAVIWLHLCRSATVQQEETPKCVHQGMCFDCLLTIARCTFQTTFFLT